MLPIDDKWACFYLLTPAEKGGDLDSYGYVEIEVSYVDSLGVAMPLLNTVVIK